MSNIKARINARRILLSYFYEKYFYSQLSQNQSAISETLKIVDAAKIVDLEKEKEELIESLNKLSSEDSLESLKKIQDTFFDKIENPNENIDYDYLAKVAPGFNRYFDEVREQVNTHTSTFQFDEMDMIDKMIFLLGYSERKILKTPREIILNEMIELGKSYGDDGTPKLINAIGHKILSA